MQMIKRSDLEGSLRRLIDTTNVRTLSAKNLMGKLQSTFTKNIPFC